MRLKLIQTFGILWTVALSTLVIWVYATQPQTIRDVTTGASVVAGTYEIDRDRFERARELFRRELYAAARDEWMRADPAERDARTQFYIAYAFYRQGWGRVYNDDALFRQGLDRINRALALAPEQGTLTVDDAELQMRTAAELKAELEGGLERSIGDFNPLRVLRERK